MNMLKKLYQTREHHPMGFWCNLGRKLINYKWYAKKCVKVLSNSAKFSAGQPVLSAHNFSATMAITHGTYCLGDLASLKFLAFENMPPHFSASVYYGQMTGWIKIPPGMEVGLGPGGIMLDGDPAPPSRKGAQQPPHFWPTALACVLTGLHFTHNPCCQLGIAQREAVMAILPDNCHPSSLYLP